MSKVALVSFNFTTLSKVWTQGLANLGIEFVLCYATNTGASAQIETPAGRFGANSPELRGFFQQFDAVLVCDTTNNLNAGSLHNYAFHWLFWNDADDPAFLFFGPHFSVAVASPAFPSDFPILRPDANNLPNTVHPADAGTASSYTPLSMGRTRAIRVRFPAENITVHLPTICNAHTNNIPYVWRLDLSAHLLLFLTDYSHRVARDGKAGEILAVPVSDPDWSYPDDTVVAYRYKNCFWLPHVTSRIYLSVNLWDMYDAPETNLFWLLYGLQCAGMTPRRPIPIFLETDHPIEARSSAPPFTVGYKEQYEVVLASYAYWQDFAQRTNTVFIHGVTVGSRHRGGGFHWNQLYGTGIPPEARAIAQQVNAQLVQYHRQGTQCCGVHDHSIGGGAGYWATAVNTGFKRHTGLDYGAPNDVPIRRGDCCVNPAVLPQGVAGADALTVQVGDGAMVEWDLLRSGAGTTFDLPMDNLHAARIIIESEIEEMRALGFPDGYCGGHKYTNTATNNSGGECYWQALKEMGFRGVRSSHWCNLPLYTKRVIPNRIWHGFHLVANNHVDINLFQAGYSRGLYHPLSPADGDAVRYYELDFSGDISSKWDTDQTLAWRAYRRVVAHTVGRWLSTSVINLGATYLHPGWAACVMNLTNPTARFDGWNLLNTANQPHFNYFVELVETMDLVVRLLPRFLKWSHITEMMDLREQVMEDWRA